MSYDPQDHIVEWRDIGAACLLCAIAFVSLLLFGGAPPIIGDDTAWRAGRAESPQAAHCQAPACIAPGVSFRTEDGEEDDDPAQC